MGGSVVSFISEKGGVGKTTACYHVAIGLQRFHAKRVLVVDADYQRGGLTGRCFPDLLENFKRGKMPGTTLFHVFRALYSGQSDLPVPDIRATSLGLDVLPSDPRLTEVSVHKLPSSNNIRENNHKLFAHLSAIKSSLEPYADRYDYILIDTHPETSELLRSVIFASRAAVSPVKLDEQSSVGVPSSIEAIKGVNADIQSLQAALGVAPDHTPTHFAGAIAMMTREYAGGLKWTESVQFRRLQEAGGIFTSYVTEGDGLRQAAAEHLPVYDVRGSNAAKQAEQFTALVTEFIARCQ